MAVVVVVPLPRIALVGKLIPAGPMLQFEMVLLSFPVVVPVEKNILPPFVLTDELCEPNIVQLVIMLFVASALNWIVDVPLPPAVVLEIVNELPPVFKPFIVTLSDPFKSIKGNPAVAAPEIVRATPPEGIIDIEVQAPAFSIAPPTGSVVFPVMVIVIVFPVCDVALI